ncbi:MAG TPA: hypothetical protein VFP79_04690 [Pseudolabrys sp.]|nr:hypothetical protein [Pseudolabrys sp.]
MDKKPPDLGEVSEAFACIVDDAGRAGDNIDRIPDHIKNAPLRKGRFDLNKAINEVIALARSAITENGGTILWPVRLSAKASAMVALDTTSSDTTSWPPYSGNR